MNTPRTFYCLDLDRTLLDTAQLVVLLEEYLTIQHPELAQFVQTARQKIEQSGGSYDILGGIRQYVADDADQLMQDFAVTSIHKGHQLLLPYAQELIEVLSAGGQSWGIMTYGGEQWQRTKLKMVGLGDVPAIIIPEKGKGRQIAAWRDDIGRYQLPQSYGGGIVEEVVLVDDKPIEFDGLPADTARGYLCRPEANEDLLPSQRGEVLSNVRIAASLHDVINFENLAVSP